MAVCASLVTYFQFHQSSFLFSVGNLSPPATTSVVATILFRITERYSRKSKNNFKTKVKISRFTLVKTEGHHDTCAHSLSSLIAKLVTSVSTFRLYSQNFDFNLEILTFWLRHKRATECLRWKYPTWQSTVLLSSLALSPCKSPTLTLLPPSLLVSVGWGRPTVTDGRPAHLLHRVRCDLRLGRDLWTAAALLQMVQENAEAAAEAIRLPEALNSQRPLGGFNYRLKHPPKKAHWKDSHEVDVL